MVQAGRILLIRRVEHPMCPATVVGPPGRTCVWHKLASATDVARLLAAALSNPTIKKVCRTYRHQFKAKNSRKNYRLVNSNRLLTSKYKVRGGKTGYIVEAGWCLANMIETSGGPIVTVVLYSRSNSWRFTDSRRLIEWALKYRRKATTAFALAF